MPQLPPSLKKILPAAAVIGAAALAALHLGATDSRCWVIFPYAGRGWELLYGIKDPVIAFSMPLLSVLATLLDYDTARLLPAVSAALFLVVVSAWNLGRIKYGRYGGLAFALAAAAVSLTRPTPHDPEQVFFTLAVLLYLNLEAARETAPGKGASFLAGLALGVTLLVRSTFFLFPLIPPALELLRRARPARTVLKEAALFLLGAYVLLLPWARLNYSVSGTPSPFEFGRADSNVITGALGSVYTMEGNPRALAGLSRGESALGWAARQVAARPAGYAAAVARRVWHIILMTPLLWLLAGAAAVWLWKARAAAALAPALYFTAIHSLMSIETRYFYPLAYLLGLAAAGGFCAALKLAADGAGRRTAALLFSPLLLCALAAEYIVLAYPGKAAGDCLSGVEAALLRRPGHPWLLYRKGECLISAKRTAEGLAALRESVRLSGEKKYSNAGDILRIMDSPAPENERAEFVGSYFGEDLLKGLRQLELGQKERAGASLAREYEAWNEHYSTLRGTPYETDRAIQRDLKLRNPDFQDRLIYEALLYWPPERRGLILETMTELFPLGGKLEALRFLSAPSGTPAQRRTLLGLALEPGLLERLEAGDYKLAAAQLAGAALPLGSVPAYGPGGLVLEPLKDRKTGLALQGRAIDAKPYSAEELKLLAAAAAGGKAQAAKLKGLRPQDPLCLALAGGKAGAAGTGLLLDAAEIYLNAGAKAGAGRLAAEAAAAAGPDQLRRAALALQGAGRYTEALGAVSRAAAAAPGNLDILNDRGVIYMLLRRDAEAEKDFTAALKGSWQAGLNLAALRLKAGRRPEAEELYRLTLAREDLPPPVRAMLERDLKPRAR